MLQQNYNFAMYASNSKGCKCPHDYLNWNWLNILYILHSFGFYVFSQSIGTVNSESNGIFLIIILKRGLFICKHENHLFKVHIVDVDHVPENIFLLMSRASANLQVQRHCSRSSCSALRTQGDQECPAVPFTLFVPRGLDVQALVTETGIFGEWLFTSGPKDSWDFFFF